MDDYGELYTRAWNDIQEERVLPGGHWKMRLANVGCVSKDGRVTKVVFTTNPAEPGPDVDKRALKELNGYDYSTNEVADFQWYNGRKEERRVAKILGMFTDATGAAIEVPSVPLIVATDKGWGINPDINKALRGAYVVQKLKIGSNYKTHEPENQVEIGGYLPVE